MLDRPIVSGRGGFGGKGGGGQARTPVESPNTLRSRSTARAIDLISEGEIAGLVDGLKSIYFDDTPLQNADGSFNFSNVTVDLRYGLPDQEPLIGFSAVESEVAVGAEVKAAAPIVRAVTNLDATSARVTVRLPSLQLADTTTGDIGPTAVQIAIDVQSSVGGFVQVIVDNIYGKTVSPYQRAYRVPLAGDGPWNVRVRRDTADSTSVSLQNQTFWDSLTEIQEYRLQYPNSAVVGLAIDAESFGGRIPARKYLARGLKTEVPTNYDPVTRSYAGTWDGTFKTAHHSNPAWVFWACIANERWGLGDYVPAAFRDKWTLYAIAQYCDGPVPDGFGGTEPRYTFNAVISTAEEAHRVLQSIASVFRGMTYWGSAGVTATADRDLDPVKLVTPANIVNGVINWSGAALKVRHSVVQVTWYDPDDLYRPNIEVVEGAPALIERFGWRVKEIVAFGCTSLGQAHRAGRWELETEASESEGVNWQAAWDHADVYPGDIVEVQDPNYAGVQFGGRIRAVPRGGTIDLDRPIELEPSKAYQLTITLGDGTLARRNVISPSGIRSSVQLDGILVPSPLAGAIWVMTSSSVSPRRVKILSRIETEGVFDISGVVHDPTKYARIELGLVLEAPAYTALPVGPILPPSNLMAQEFLAFAPGGVVRNRVVLSWQASPDPRVIGYDIQVRPPDQDWQSARPSFSPGISEDLFDLTDGGWGFRVRARDNLGRPSPWITKEGFAVAGLLAPPPAVDNFISAYDNFNRVYLTWTPSADFRPLRYELRKGDSWDAAQTVGDVAHAPWGTTGDGLYWIAAFIGAAAGLRIYSTTKRSLTITNSVLHDNIVVTHDEQAEGFTGTFTGSAAVGTIGGDTVIRTGGASILDVADILAVPSILNYGGIVNGFYTSPHIVNLGRRMPFRSSIEWVGTGIPADQNILDNLDILLNPDVLVAAQARLASVYPVVRLSDTGSPYTWGPWFRWSPDVQNAWGVQFGIALETADPTVIAILLTFAWTIDVEDRLDRYTNLTIAAGGTALSFVPGGFSGTPSGTARAFNGGANGASSLPNISNAHRGPNAGDLIRVSSLTLSGCTVHVINAGVSVGGTQVDLLVQGY